VKTVASLIRNIVAKTLSYAKIGPGDKVTITDIESVPDEVWGCYSKALVSLGYDIRGAEDAKMLTRKRLKKNNDVVVLDEEHAEAFKQALGIKDIYKPKKTPKNILNKAIKTFGITENPERAGYILTDGRMLDLSEFQQGRTLDHRSIERAMGEKWTEALREFLNMGNIRLTCTPTTVIFDLKKRPTADQVSTMRTIIRDHSKSSVIVEAAGRHKEFTDRDPNYEDVDGILAYIKESF
jgi:hypothetical protein